MPWESFKCELPALELAEIASPVVSLLAQPHRLELYVRGRSRPLTYFPDLELTVEASLFDRLLDKEPFAQALLQWRPGPRSQLANYRKVIVEVKDDADRRNEDREYQTKLRLGEAFMTFINAQSRLDEIVQELEKHQHLEVQNCIIR